MWNYLTAPFVFVAPGVRAHEIEPWQEDGETWRRLAVTFPETIANHNAEQVFYYDDQLRLRRMDYSPDVTGSPPVAHYTHESKTFDGFVFPTRRRVLLHDADGGADQSFAPITVDVRTVTVTNRLRHERHPRRRRGRSPANRGLGRDLAEQLLERGAAKVYATARDPRQLDLAGVVPLQVDITDPASVAHAAELPPTRHC